MTDSTPTTQDNSRPVVLSIETMTAIGGNRWTRGDKDRVYINDWARFAGLEVSLYKTGNVSSATYQGEVISNSQAVKLLGSLLKVWFDTADGDLHCQYSGTESRVASPEELWDAVAQGIRDAIAALPST